MARITIEDCMHSVENRFELVLMAAKRARQVANGSEPLVAPQGDKPSVIALREIAERLIDENAVGELQLQLDARRAAEEQERENMIHEVGSDD